MDLILFLSENTSSVSVKMGENRVCGLSCKMCCDRLVFLQFQQQDGLSKAKSKSNTQSGTT